MIAEDSEKDRTIRSSLKPDENAFSFLTKTKFSPIFNFFDIPPVSYLVGSEGLKAGDVMEIFFEDNCHGCLLIYKLLISFILPSFIVNEDPITSKFCSIISFKDDGSEDNIKVLYFANSRYFRYHQFLDIFETAIMTCVRKRVFHPSIENLENQGGGSDDLIFRVFGGEAKYRNFIVNCLKKLYVLYCCDAFNFRCKMELLDLSWDNGPKYRVIIVDNVRCFRIESSSFFHGRTKNSVNENSKREEEELVEIGKEILEKIRDKRLERIKQNINPKNEDWVIAMEKLRELANKQNVSIILGRNPKNTISRKKKLFVKDIVFVKPDRIASIADDLCPYYKNIWLNKIIDYNIVMGKVGLKNFLIMKKLVPQQNQLSSRFKSIEKLIERVYEYSIDRDFKTLVFMGEEFGN